MWDFCQNPNYSRVSPSFPMFSPTCSPNGPTSLHSAAIIRAQASVIHWNCSQSHCHPLTWFFSPHTCFPTICSPYKCQSDRTSVPSPPLQLLFSGSPRHLWAHLLSSPPCHCVQLYCSSLNISSSVLSQDFCMCCSLYPEYSSLRFQQGLFFSCYSELSINLTCQMPSLISQLK